MASLHNRDKKGKRAQEWLHIMTQLVDSPCGDSFDSGHQMLLQRSCFFAHALEKGVLPQFDAAQRTEFPILTAGFNMSLSGPTQIASWILHGEPVCKQQQHVNLKTNGKDQLSLVKSSKRPVFNNDNYMSILILMSVCVWGRGGGKASLRGPQQRTNSLWTFKPVGKSGGLLLNQG